MLERLSVENFTVFSKASFEFAAGLNVIVGENGTGKTHVLKLAYAVLAESYHQGKLQIDVILNEAGLHNFYEEKIGNVFHSRSDRLIRGLKNSELSVSFGFDETALDCAFTIDTIGFGKIHKRSNQWLNTRPVFITTRELLTIYPGFVSLYEGRYLEFDETYYDTCLLLGDPPLRKPMADLLSVLEEAMGGKVNLEGGRFYLVVSDDRKIEMPMVAEGLRKLAMLAQLVAVGALQKGGYLFWDEPEANLNPRLVKVIARVILQLAKAGIQIFIATHSYFLLKELDILTMEQPIPTRYFSLLKGEDGVVVESGDSLDDLQTIVALDEELAQFDREQDAHHA
jgi:ABC-type transport system involved in cytochrome c biogenesis ATPase subunit